MESHMGQRKCTYWRETPERNAGTNVHIGKKDRESEVEDWKKKGLKREVKGGRKK